MGKITKILAELEETQNLVRIMAVDDNGYNKIALGRINFYMAGDDKVVINNIHMPKKTFKIEQIKTIEIMAAIWNKKP